MQATSSSPCQRAIPWGLIGMIGLVGAFETQKVRRDFALISGQAASWRFTARQLNYRGKSAEILCLGDSLIKFGVVPQVLEHETGKSAFNLALLSAPAPASYMMLSRVLERGGRPRAVLVDFNCEILKEGPRSTKRPYPWADLLTFAELAELSRVLREPDFFVRVTLNRVLAAVKNRFEIRENVLAALNNQPIHLRDVAPGFERNWTFNGGAQVHGKRSYQEGALPPDAEPQVSDGSCDPVNAIYLERFLNLAKRRDITVFWVIPPFSPINQAWMRYLGEEAAFDRFLNLVQERHPELVVLDARYSGYVHDLFFDGVHLDGDGAAGFSVALARCVNLHLAAPGTSPRRVKLPAYRPFVGSTPIEVFGSSVVALRARDAAVRR